MQFKDEKNTKDKVLFVINAPGGGGAERAIGLIAQQFEERNLNYDVLAVNSGENDPELKNLEIRCLDRQWQSGFFSFLVTLIKFQRFVQKAKPNLVVVNCDLPELLISLTYFRGKILLVEHSSNPWHNRRALGRVVRKILATRIDRVILVAPHLVPWNCEKISRTYIPNAIVANSDLNETLVSKGPITRIIFVGRLVKYQKQPDWLVEISRCTKLQVVFIGEGDYKNDLTDLCIKSGIQFCFTGYLKNPWSYFRNGDILVVPSKFEGSPLLVLEAIKNQIPIILNDIPDLRQFNLPAKHYFEDKDKMAKAIIFYANQIEYFIPKLTNFQSRMLEHDPILVADKWLIVLNEMIP
jgi:glycosyltransferase involved in cell wall biosynthesis